jgi:hypothetical protein
MIFLTCMWQIHGNLLKKVWISYDLTWPQSILWLRMWEHRTLQNHELSEDSKDSYNSLTFQLFISVWWQIYDFMDIFQYCHHVPQSEYL